MSRSITVRRAAVTVLTAGLAVTATGMGQPASADRAADAARLRGSVALIAALGSRSMERISLAKGHAEPPVRLRGGRGPIAVVVTPNQRTAYVANVVAGTVSPVDIATRHAAMPIKVASYPSELLMSPGGRTVYVASTIDGDNQYPGRITPISTATNRSGKPVKVGIDPGPVVLTPNGKTLYVSTSGYNSQTGASNVTVISTARDRIVKIIRGADVPAFAMAPSGRTLYMATGSKLLALSTASNKVVGSVRLGSVAWSLAISPGGAAVYALTDKGVVRIATATMTAGPATPVPGEPGFLAMAPGGTAVFVVNGTGRHGLVSEIRVATGAAMPTVQVAQDPTAIAFSRGTAYLVSAPFWASGEGNLHFRPGALTPISVRTGLAGQPVTLDRGPMAIAIVG